MDKKLRFLKTSDLVVTLPQPNPSYIFIRGKYETIGDSTEAHALYPNRPASGFADLIRKTETINTQ